MENSNTSIQKLEPVTAAQLSGYLDAMGLATKLTEKEKTQFLEISMAFGLNPFKREIYCSKYGEGANAQMAIIVGYETYIKRAERSGQLDGWQVITQGSVKDNDLKAIITIHRKDRKFPFIHEVYYSEYVQTKSDGSPNKFWQKAQTMIKKVAMAQGFRLCFSDELGGMPYTQEEMPSTEDAVYSDVTTVNVTQIDSRGKSKEDIEKLINACQNETDVKSVWKSLNAYEKNLPDIKDLVKAKGESFKNTDAAGQ